MEFKELVRKNRSYRGFDGARRIDREELVQLADLARLCPSSVNKQPFKYYLACEKEVVDKIQKETKWAKALPEISLPHEGMCPTAFIVICQDTRIDESLTRYQRDVGIVAQTMLLAAVDKGLGGCMIGNFGAASVKEVLELPEYLVPMLILALGKPAETVVLEEIEEGESIVYYRDEQDVHHVPKRKLEDILL